MYSPSIQKLIDSFSKFPTVGQRTASRFVFYLIKEKKENVEALISSIKELKEKIKTCSFCFNPFEGESYLCPICSDPRRDKTTICVVEKEADLISIEKIKKYQGLFFILGSAFSLIKNEDIRIKELEERIKNPEKFGITSKIKEVIIATNSTYEGESTGLYLERKIKELPVSVKKLGRGLSTGAEIEYADQETLESAFEGRK